jgi:hypothetical protein
MWRRHFVVFALLPRSASQAGQELLANGDFAEPLEAVAGATSNFVERVDVSAGTMVPFPGSATTALQIAARSARTRQPAGSAARVELRSAAMPQRSGWYRVRCFVLASVGYNGREGLLSLEVVGMEDQPLWPARTISLREHRAEWLFYEQYVAANMVLGVLDGHADAMLSALRVVIDPGAGFTAGAVQLTGLSVEFVSVADRPGLIALDLCECTEPRTPSGLCGSGATPSCGNPAGCPVAALGDSERYPSSGTCQDTFVSLGGTSPAAAFDGVALADTDGWYIAGSAADVVTLQIEIPGGPVPVCGAVLTFARWSYPQRWRLGANSNPNESYRTWVSAGRVSGVTGRDWREVWKKTAPLSLFFLMENDNLRRRKTDQRRALAFSATGNSARCHVDQQRRRGDRARA